MGLHAPHRLGIIRGRQVLGYVASTSSGCLNELMHENPGRTGRHHGRISTRRAYLFEQGDHLQARLTTHEVQRAHLQGLQLGTHSRPRS